MPADSILSFPTISSIICHIATTFDCTDFSSNTDTNTTNFSREQENHGDATEIEQSKGDIEKDQDHYVNNHDNTTNSPNQPSQRTTDDMIISDTSFIHEVNHLNHANDATKSTKPTMAETAIMDHTNHNQQNPQNSNSEQTTEKRRSDIIPSDAEQANEAIKRRKTEVDVVDY